MKASDINDSTPNQEVFAFLTADLQKRGFGKMKKSEGYVMGFSGGREPHTPACELIPSTYHNRNKGEINLQIYTSASSEHPIELSLETLYRILEWASDPRRPKRL